MELVLPIIGGVVAIGILAFLLIKVFSVKVGKALGIITVLIAVIFGVVMFFMKQPTPYEKEQQVQQDFRDAISSWYK